MMAQLTKLYGITILFLGIFLLTKQDLKNTLDHPEPRGLGKAVTWDA